MYLFWLGFILVWSVPVLLLLWLIGFHFYLVRKYIHHVERIFPEVPFFNIPRGRPTLDAEDITFPTADGLSLRGCYFRTPRPRRGVILFGLEFGSDRWSCRAYCEHLIDAGYEVFAFEPRGQGESDPQPNYEPLQWVTDFEVKDTLAALDYLRKRPDADPRGVGFFGISKGGGAGLIAASRDRSVRCCVTDGVFGTYSTLVPYMRHFFRIYNKRYTLQGMIPSWYYGRIGLHALRRIARRRHCRFPHLEKRMPRLAPRPLLMIHGEADSYIKPEMAEQIFVRARQPKEFWLVPHAKHNQALHLYGDEYRRRVLDFFNRHLAGEQAAGQDSDPVGSERFGTLTHKPGDTDSAGPKRVPTTRPGELSEAPARTHGERPCAT